MKCLIKDNRRPNRKIIKVIGTLQHHDNGARSSKILSEISFKDLENHFIQI